MGLGAFSRTCSTDALHSVPSEPIVKPITSPGRVTSSAVGRCRVIRGSGHCAWCGRGSWRAFTGVGGQGCPVITARLTEHVTLAGASGDWSHFDRADGQARPVGEQADARCSPGPRGTVPAVRGLGERDHARPQLVPRPTLRSPAQPAGHLRGGQAPEASRRSTAVGVGSAEFTSAGPTYVNERKPCTLIRPGIGCRGTQTRPRALATPRMRRGVGDGPGCGGHTRRVALAASLATGRQQGSLWRGLVRDVPGYIGDPVEGPGRCPWSSTVPGAGSHSDQFRSHPGLCGQNAANYLKVASNLIVVP